MKKLLVVGLMSVLPFGHAAADVLDDIQEAGVLKVGTEMQFAPFDYLENGKQTGFNKALFAEFGKALGVKVEFVDLPWTSVLPGLEAGKYDMVAGPLVITEERMKRYHFTAPIAEGTAALLVRADDEDIKKPADISGKVAGAGKSTAQLAALEAYSATLSETVDIREYVDNNQAYADLAARRLDAVANSLPNIAFIAQKRPGMFKVVTPAFAKKSWFGYITRGDDDSKRLIEAFDDLLKTARDDGTLASLQEKWIGQAMEVPEQPEASE